MTWTEASAGIALAAMAIGLVLCLVRIVRGPTLFDRIAAFDCLVLDVVGAIVLISIRAGTDAYIDVVLVVALLGFVGTLSFAAYLEGTLDD